MKLTDLRQLSGQFSYEDSQQMSQQLSQALWEMGYDPDNLYQELEMSSRFVDTHQDSSDSNALVQLHSHTFYEIIYCRTSCGAEYLVGTERYRLQRGDIICVPPGISHRPLLPEQMKEPYKRYVLWVSADFMEHYIQLFSAPHSWIPVQAGVLRTAGTKWENISDLFRSGVQEAEQQANGWEAAVLGNTISLLTQLRRAVDAPSARPMKAEKPELLDQAMAYIEKNYRQHLELSDVAKHFYVSTSTISHLFKEKMGTSFYRCVTQRRLIAAKERISKGEQLESVGHQVGFSDYSTFYRAFKQEFGISPRQYRKVQDSDSRKSR